MAKTKKDRKEQLEKKKLAERIRKAKIKNNPEKYEQYLKKDRERYYKNKSSKRIISIAQLSQNKRHAIREKNRLASKRYRDKKKNLTLQHAAEQLIDVSLVEDMPDPLGSTADALPSQSECIQTDDLNNPQISKSDLMVNSLHKVEQSASGSRVVTRNLRSNSRSISTTPVTHVLSRSRATIPKTLKFNSELLRSPTPSTCSALSSDNSSATSISENQAPKKSQMLRKYRYKINKEYKILHKRIEELTQLNTKYRKQVFRLQKNINDARKSSKDTDAVNSDSSCTEEFRNGKICKLQLEEIIRNFYLDDENSRMCPGKKEHITKNKIKKQKRYLSETVLNLHKKFNVTHPHLKVSYSHFWKLKPFWVIAPNLNIRDTCLCKKHENMELLVNSLRKNGILNEKTSRDVLTSLCCNIYDPKCLSRKCKTCKNKLITYKEFDNSEVIYYWEWKNVTKQYVKDGQTKSAIQCAKTKVSATPKNAIIVFEKTLNPYLQHCSNIVSQSDYIKKIKQNLTEEEAVVHCDFSENYNMKYANEIQAMHFGGSRQQITLHTVVIYFVLNGNSQSQAFCTVSKCLRHDAVAIWAHLLPILKFIEDNAPKVDVIHFVSDSPSGQYRNRKLFYVISKLHWHYPILRFVTWNYSEAGHGKGAPDGVGAILKRTADQTVARGHDIPDLETWLLQLKSRVPGVVTEVITESAILEKDLLIPTLAMFRGTMQVHQVVWDANNKYILALRKLSCGLDECATTSTQCKHGYHIGFFNIGTQTDHTKQDSYAPIEAVHKNHQTEPINIPVYESAKETVTCSSIHDQQTLQASRSVDKSAKILVHRPLTDPKKAALRPIISRKSSKTTSFNHTANVAQTSKETTKSYYFSKDKANILIHGPQKVSKSFNTFGNTQSSENVVEILSNELINSSTPLQSKKDVLKNVQLSKRVDLPKSKFKKTFNTSLVKGSEKKVKTLPKDLQASKLQQKKTNKEGASGSSIISSDDSFWVTVPSIDEMALTPTVGHAILSTLVDTDESDEDYNIF